MSTSTKPVLPALAYFLTFRTYGTWLPGDARGWVGVDNRPGAPMRSGQPSLEAKMRALLVHPPTLLDATRREIVFAAVQEVCAYRRWLLLAGNVLTNHTPWVVRAPNVHPNRVMTDFKGYSTRRLREAGLVGDETEVWARGGKRDRLLNRRSVDRACLYVVERQGTIVGRAPWWDDDGPRLTPSVASSLACGGVCAGPEVGPAG